MNALTIILVLIPAYLVAYHTYGRYLSRKIFKIDPEAVCPSRALQDDVDFVPTDRNVLFGHHFTSIAGLGPIVGPAVAVIWGWVPAVLWVLFGSIFIGAVHDFGTLVLSLRGRGRSIGDIASEVVNGRVRTMFLLVIFFELWILIAVFALILAILFEMYPQAVLPVWLEIPIAVVLGHLIYRRGMGHRVPGLVAVCVMYLTVVLGTFFPLAMPRLFGLDPLVLWMLIMLVYAYVASTLPVQVLLQPRDYINSHQLLLAMALLVGGLIVARPVMVAPGINLTPEGAPPILPFLFVVIACGAISGFHSLVASGTSSKQCDSETSALSISYGGMLTEGLLAALVIVSVGAGLGMGLRTGDGILLKGADAFNHQYASWGAANGLAAKLGAFVTGAANLVSALGIPEKITITLMGVFLVSFAATTMDSATRIQRYVISELAEAWNVRMLSGRKQATVIAVASAFFLAFSNGTGKGALTLWPLFGAVNQLLAGLALLVLTIYLARRGTNMLVTGIPMLLMIVLTAWAMVHNLKRFFSSSNWLLFAIGLAVLALDLWMVAECAIVLRKLSGESRQTPDLQGEESEP